MNEKWYLDRRVLVTGRKSHINMHNFIRLAMLPEGGLTNQVLAKISNEDYDVDWVDISTLIGSVLQPIDIANTLFVTTNGDNGTAIIGRLDLPWADPISAIAASATGQTVYVFPGTYAMTPGVADRLVKNGVVLYVAAGATINIEGANSKSIFDILTAAQGQFKILGDGDFNIAGLDSLEYIVTPSKDTFDFTWEFNNMILTNISGPLFNDGFVDVRIKGDYMVGKGQLLGFRSVGGVIHNVEVEIDQMVKTTVATLPIIGVRGMDNSKVNIRVKDMVCISPTISWGLGVIYLDRNAADTMMNIDVDKFTYTATTGDIHEGIIESNLDQSFKSISIRNIRTTGSLYRAIDSAVLVPKEYGTIEFQGVLTYDVANGVRTDGTIDFRQDNQRITFDLNLFNEDTRHAILNITNGYLQKITGSLYNEDYPVGPFPAHGVVDYGLYDGVLTNPGFLPTLTNLTMVCVNQFCMNRTSVVNGSRIPCINSWSNNNVDTVGNGGVLLIATANDLNISADVR